MGILLKPSSDQVLAAAFSFSGSSSKNEAEEEERKKMQKPRSNPSSKKTSQPQTQPSIILSEEEAKRLNEFYRSKSFARSSPFAKTHPTASLPVHVISTTTTNAQVPTVIPTQPIPIRSTNRITDNKSTTATTQPDSNSRLFSYYDDQLRSQDQNYESLIMTASDLPSTSNATTSAENTESLETMHIDAESGNEVLQKGKVNRAPEEAQQVEKKENKEEEEEREEEEDDLFFTKRVKLSVSPSLPSSVESCGVETTLDWLKNQLNTTEHNGGSSRPLEDRELSLTEAGVLTIDYLNQNDPIQDETRLFMKMVKSLEGEEGDFDEEQLDEEEQQHKSDQDNE